MIHNQNEMKKVKKKTSKFNQTIPFGFFLLRKNILLHFLRSLIGLWMYRAKPILNSVYNLLHRFLINTKPIYRFDLRLFAYIQCLEQCEKIEFSRSETSKLFDYYV